MAESKALDGAFATERRQKLDKLREAGIDPYPAAAWHRSHTVGAVVDDPAGLEASGEPVRLCGRLTARRKMGKAGFADLLDQGQRIQLYFNRAELPEEVWAVWSGLDIGDFVGVEGPLFRTRTGELSLDVKTCTLLGKASQLLPIGKTSATGTHEALADAGKLARMRHVNLIAEPDLRDRIIARARVLREIRRYFDEAGFIEVETPVLGMHYGGAAAEPFTTHLKAQDRDMFLRISPECALKRALCGGLERIYEIGRNFRNEGIDASHNPEFTMMEWYQAYSDYREQMTHFETLIPRLAEIVTGSTTVSFRGRDLDLAAPWRRLPVLDAVQEATGLDMRTVPVEDLAKVYGEHHPEGAEAVPDHATWGDGVMGLFEALVEPKLWEPTFVMDHPLDVSPLTKVHRDDPRLVERFEPIIAGMEVGNAYSELNDPWEQYKRLKEQSEGREENYDLDLDFVLAMCHGMPQAGGSGLGIDRLVMLLTDAPTIREVMLFPMSGTARKE